MPSEEKHTNQTEQGNNQILVGDIVDHSVSGKKA